MPEDQPNASVEPCRICANLRPVESAFQKYGWPENDTSLPAVAAELIVVRDFRPYDSRSLQIWQCPLCGTYYLYQTDYEYLVNGSEDEETLTRLTGEEAAKYLSRPQSV